MNDIKKQIDKVEELISKIELTKSIEEINQQFRDLLDSPAGEQWLPELNKLLEK